MSIISRILGDFEYLPDETFFDKLTGDEIETGAVKTEEGTIDGDEMIGFPTSSTSVSPGFGSWTTADANRPTWLLIEVRAETDGSTDAVVSVSVDESGGTSADYTVVAAQAPNALGAGNRSEETSLLPLPPGAQFRVNQGSDPNNGNQVASARVFQL